MDYLSIDLFVLMPIIFFIYGISFFMLGVTIAVENLSPVEPVRFKRFAASPLGCLSVFGLVHGLFEFIFIFGILYGESFLFVRIIRLFVLSASFYYLFRFGTLYGAGSAIPRAEKAVSPLSTGSGEKTVLSRFAQQTGLPNLLSGIWLLLCLSLLLKEGISTEWFTTTEMLSRYLIGLPGALAASFALAASIRDTTENARKYLLAASIAFALYAFLLSITPRADFFPASILNHENFYKTTHVPTQVFRTVCAVIITFSLLKMLRLSRAFTSIHSKSVLHVMSVVVAPSLCVILLFSYLFSNALLKFSYRENENLTALTASRIETMFNHAGESVIWHIVSPRFAHDGAREDILTSLFRENADINGLAYFDADGEILRVRKDASSQAISYRGNIRSARTRNLFEGVTPEIATGGFILQGHDDRNLYSIIHLSKGHIEVLLDLKRLYEVTDKMKMGKSRHVFFVDDKGGIVLPGERENFPEKEVFARTGPDQGIYGKSSEYKGILYNAIEKKIASTGWHVVTLIPRSEIVEPIFGVFKGLVAGFLVVYLSAVVIAILFVRRITRPIDLIAERVKSIGREEYATSSPIRTADELQVLSEEVEKMALLLMEKKKMEKHIMQTEKIASLGRLVSGVAHEINNPLGVILGYCQVLLKETGTENRHYDDLKIIEKQALACKKIVEDLLQFSRANRQMNTTVDLNTNVREALSLVGKYFSKEHISVVFETDPSLPKILGDPDRLHQVFLNLAVNAADSMKKAGGSLTISTRTLEAGTEKLAEVAFRDTGCGISRKDLERIFDPFFTTKKVGEGTGLGLSVSYGIVKEHNGRIEVESAEGKGSIFHVIFPALQNDEQ